MKILTTTEAVINALGGNRPVAELLGVSGPAVSNWRAFGQFPADTYVAIQDILSKRRLKADPTLWPMRGTQGCRAS